MSDLRKYSKIPTLPTILGMRSMSHTKFVLDNAV